MKSLLKRLFAREEIDELERWHLQWHEHRRWFAEFPVAALVLDRMKAKVEGVPLDSIAVARNSCRNVPKE